MLHSRSCGRQSVFPLQGDSLAHMGQVRRGPAQLIVDRLGESGLAMHDVGMLRRRVETAQPVERPA